MSAESQSVVAIDTSGSFCSIAVKVGEKVVAALSSPGSGDHFEQLPLMLGRAYSEAKVPVSSLSEIRIGIGPGSFTGLRIGMSFAKGLAWSARVPLSGCSSLAGVATAVMARDESVGRVVVVADARRDEVFAAAFERGSPVTEALAPRIVPIAELFKAPWAREGTFWASPQRDFSIPGLSINPEHDTAKGLLFLPMGAPKPFSLNEIAVLEPTYLRAVAAKTIEERRLGT